MESSQLQRMAEISRHCHLSRSSRAACSTTESASHTAAEADDVLSDICHSAGSFMCLLIAFSALTLVVWYVTGFSTLINPIVTITEGGRIYLRSFLGALVIKTIVASCFVEDMFSFSYAF